MKVAIIAANGGLFDAYKVFNIATAAAALLTKNTGEFMNGRNRFHREKEEKLLDEK